MAYVNMAHMPKPATEYTVNFFELNGGLNVNNLEFRLTNKESPAMRNLIWREGVLCSREGQEWVVDDQLHEFTKMEVSLAPTQDLHGYDHPWPAGGGKNKAQFYAEYDRGSSYATGTPRTYSDGILTISGTVSAANTWFYREDITTLMATLGTATFSLNIFSGSLDNLTIRINVDEPGQTTQRYKLDVEQTLTYSSSKTYTLEGTTAYSATVGGSVNLTTGIQIEAGSTKTEWAPFSNICPITGHSGANVYVKAAYDASATATVSVTFPDDPGTVYGGSYDFVSGKLTVDRAIQDIGDRWWTYDSAGNRFSVAFNDAPVIAGWNKIDIRCSCYRTGPVATDSGTDMTVGIWNKYVYIRDSSCTSTAELRTARAGQKIVYQLATPLVYDLTPQSIPTFSGQKVVWSDAGDVETQLSSILAAAYTIYDRPFHEHLFAHIGTKIYTCDPEADTPAWDEVCSGVPEARGTFFHYYDDLFYKTAGGYFKITYSLVGTTPTFTGAAVDGYVPVTVINASPDTGSGDLYQPENRIQSKKTVWYNAEEDVVAYHLPVVADSIIEVKVDGTVTTGYTYSDGVVTFNTAPPVTDPPTNNTVEITYSKANTDAYNAVMDCPYAITYGGTGDLCVVMGGCPAQPNAFFWNGNHIVMDATYFPMSNYQLAGDTDDMITGFGKQQSFLVVFKEHSIGRAKQSTEEIDGRVTVDMPYMAINDRIGCDLPWSIQLIDNNLVWCNTEQGVHILKDSSYAYENNIECVSLKVNKSSFSAFTLLNDVRSGTVVCSADDETHYWLVANGHAWLWDYENSHYKTPSWYFYTNIGGVAFATDHDDTWHINSAGRLTKFNRLWRDYGGPIDKSFRFTVQYFGGYDRLKNVNSVIFSLRPDTDSVTKLTYITDYESREDLTDLVHTAWRLVPRDLSYRNLAGTGFGAVFRRRPMCRRVKHFTMQLDNNIAGQDLSIVSAQIFYNYQGRLR